MSSYFARGYSLHLIIVLLACQRRKAMRGAEELSLHPPGWETGLQSSQAEPSPRGVWGTRGVRSSLALPGGLGKMQRASPISCPHPCSWKSRLGEEGRHVLVLGLARSSISLAEVITYVTESMGSPSCCSSWGGPHNLLQPTAFPGYGTSILKHYSP